MTSCTGTDPGIGEFLSMAAVQIMAGPQGDHRGQHGIDPGECFTRVLCLLNLCNGFMDARRKSLWIFDHPRDVLMFG